MLNKFMNNIFIFEHNFCGPNSNYSFNLFFPFHKSNEFEGTVFTFVI